MKVAIPKERRPDETRVAATPDTLKKLVGLGLKVAVEKGAGAGSSIPDEMFKDAGASIAASYGALVKDADIVLKVQRPMTESDGTDEIGPLKAGTALICNLQARQDRATVDALAAAKVDAFAMELMPRITRAQSMDILSSQSNLAGYKAVIDAAAEFGRAMPMMMTAAGTVAPARVLVFGAGVAGLQAIATAKRLGAVVLATDVRYAAKEQVESLGGKFLTADEEAMKEAETEGGYAKEMSDAFKKKQADLITAEIGKADIVITTALIPGRPAPLLVTEDQVKLMKPGSVIVDLAAEAGGNVATTQAGKKATKHGVTVLGYTNVPARLGRDASTLYAKNLLNFLGLIVDKDGPKLSIDEDDDIIKGIRITKDGAVVHPALTGEGA